MWDAASGKETRSLKGHKGVVSSVAFSPDSKKIVSGGWDCTMKVWDASSGQEMLTLKGHTQLRRYAGRIQCVAKFSPDGKNIVSCSDDKTLKVWDATSGQETLTLKGHTSDVNEAWPSARTAKKSSAVSLTRR